MQEHCAISFFKKSKKTYFILLLVFILVILTVAVIAFIKKDNVELETILGVTISLSIFSIIILIFYIHSLVTLNKLMMEQTYSIITKVNKISLKINRNKHGIIYFYGFILKTDMGKFHYYLKDYVTLKPKQYKEVKNIINVIDFETNIMVFEKTKIIYRAIDNTLYDIIEKIKKY